MTDAELALFDDMDGRDQVHSIAVARRVAESTSAGPVIAAALLHDVGKAEAGYGLAGRVVATVLGVVAGDALVSRWHSSGGWRGRMASHLAYPEVGRRFLEDAGSDVLVSTWAAEHHRPPEEWTVPTDIGRVLAAADH